MTRNDSAEAVAVRFANRYPRHDVLSRADFALLVVQAERRRAVRLVRKSRIGLHAARNLIPRCTDGILSELERAMLGTRPRRKGKP